MRVGVAGQYNPGAFSALTKIVLYSSSVYTVFHSVIYNSEVAVYPNMQCCKAPSCPYFPDVENLVQDVWGILFKRWSQIIYIY